MVVRLLTQVLGTNLESLEEQKNTLTAELLVFRPKFEQKKKRNCKVIPDINSEAVQSQH